VTEADAPQGGSLRENPLKECSLQEPWGTKGYSKGWRLAVTFGPQSLQTFGEPVANYGTFC